MNDSRDNTGAFGSDGFDWSSESEKMKKNFDSFGFDRQPYYDGFEKKNKSGDSVFSDGFYRPGERSYYADDHSYDFPPYSPARDGSVYNHSEVRRSPRPTGQSGRAASQKKTSDKRKSVQSGKGRQASSEPGKKRKPSKPPTKNETQKKQPASSAGKKRPGEANPDKSNRKIPQNKPKTTAQKMADAGEKRRWEKSRENYDKAIRQGKSKDELRKIRLKKKRRARKIKIAATVSAVVVFAVIVALIFCFVKGAPIEKIVIEGSTLYKESEILTAAGISEGDNMLMIRQRGTNDAVTKALPYIAKVKVDYQLPDTLRLVISETTDKYYVVNGEGYICIDENDKVVSDVKKKVKGKRYRIEGLEKQEYQIGTKFSPGRKNGNEQKYKIAKKIAAAIDSCGLKNCNVINVKNTDRIFVVYNNKVWMYLKADSDFEYEMRFAAQAVNDSRTKEIIESSEKCYIDLRLGNQAVFKTGELS